MKDVLFGSGVMWDDPPSICDSAYRNQRNRIREDIAQLEGECLQYDVTYELVRGIYGVQKYRKGSSGSLWSANFWDFFNRKLLVENLEVIKDEDNSLEWL